MTVDALIEDRRWDAAGLGRLAEPAVCAALRHLGLAPGDYEISLLGCGDGRIAALNADFRGSPRPTNVLSWPSADRGAGAPGRVPDRPVPGELGDIAIAYETCAREARDQGKDFADHVRHLIVHAVLHLLGYDHTDAQDAALMERLEVEILATLGVPDPY